MPKEQNGDSSSGRAESSGSDSPLHQNGAPEGRAGSEPSVVQVALGGRCPRCGAKTLFDGIAGFADRCRVCGLDYGRFNVGDGPAAFLTLIIGAVVVGFAIWLELAVKPPLWVHALIWIPLTAIAVVLGLRLGKAALLALEYRHEAAEAISTTGENGGNDAPDSSVNRPKRRDHE